VNASVVALSGGPVEVLTWTGSTALAPIVLLHEGLGSARLWRSFPSALAVATGRRVVAPSRHGYGRSGPASLPRRPWYMHHEAQDVLPEFLSVLGISSPVLVGHSDGASIALLYAGGSPAGGVVAIAPHVIVEDRSIAGIEAARSRYLSSDLPERMARHHADAEATFWGWNDIWLSPEFRAWDIRAELAGLSCPVLAVQAADDEYGTLAQLNLLAASVAAPVERLVLDAGGHSPHLSRASAVVEAVSAFVGSLG
jgi:pimeloyl-ACP methyl ester carboxylesterase